MSTKNFLFGVLWLLLGYGFLCYLISISEFFQSIFIYLSWVRWPLWNSSLKDLRSLRIPWARNIALTMKDGIQIHGYHLPPLKVISEDFLYMSDFQDSSQSHLYPENDIDNSVYNDALGKAERIVLFFHGNAASRAFYHRIHTIKQLSELLDAHVLSFDYRGFADSGGWPSETAIRQDSIAIITWLYESIILPRCAANSSSAQCLSPRIYLYGQSLGTAIATELAVDINHQLQPSSMAVHGLILDSPFASVLQAVKTYPLAQVFRVVPFIEQFL